MGNVKVSIPSKSSSVALSKDLVNHVIKYLIFDFVDIFICICLFVSFEVKSKEDLSGLKLLCDYETFSEGFEFYKDKKSKLNWVKVFFLSKDTGKIIHAFGFDKTFNFKNGLNLDTAITKTFRFHDKRSHDPDNYMNHLSPKDNELFADYLYSKFTDELLFA